MMGVREAKSFRPLTNVRKSEWGSRAELPWDRDPEGFILGVPVAEDSMGLEAGNCRNWQTPGLHQQLWPFMCRSGAVKKGVLCICR